MYFPLLKLYFYNLGSFKIFLLSFVFWGYPENLLFDIYPASVFWGFWICGLGSAINFGIFSDVIILIIFFWTLTSSPYYSKDGGSTSSFFFFFYIFLASFYWYIVKLTDSLQGHFIHWWAYQIRSVAQSCPTLCDSMNRSTPGLPVHHQLPEFTHSHPSGQWCHPAISYSVIPFSSCPQSLPASESFPVSQLFTWGGKSTGV